MGWNLHVIGSEIEDDIKTAVHDFAVALKTAGHSVESVIFTDDNGQHNLTPIAKAAEEVAEIAGVKKSQIKAAIAVIEDALDAAEAFADKLADDTETDTTAADGTADNQSDDKTDSATPAPAESPVPDVTA